MTRIAPLPAPVLDVLLIDTKELGHLCGLSPRTIRRLDSAAKIPRAVKCGSSKRWRAEEVRRWVAAGCPNRAKWEHMQDQS